MGVAATVTYNFAVSNQGWTAAVESGSTSNPFTWGTPSDDTVNAWYTDGVASSSIKTLTSPEMEVASDGSVTITIEHRYHFEVFTLGGGQLFMDGGQVRYRINGGSWTPVADGQFSQNGYTGWVLSLFSSGWSGTSSGYSTQLYVSSVATLSGLTAGDTLELQLRAGWDSSIVWTAPNWAIGEVSVSNVVPEPGETAGYCGLALLVWSVFRRRRGGQS